MPQADQHNQCYQCRDQVLLSTSDLTLSSQQLALKSFHSHFNLDLVLNNHIDKYSTSTAEVALP